jgi:hypothetical protein
MCVHTLAGAVTAVSVQLALALNAATHTGFAFYSCNQETLFATDNLSQTIGVANANQWFCCNVNSNRYPNISAGPAGGPPTATGSRLLAKHGACLHFRLCGVIMVRMSHRPAPVRW